MQLILVGSNGRLEEQITSGISKDEFINRVRKALGAGPLPGVTQRSNENPQEPPPALPAQPPPANEPVIPAQAEASEEQHPISPILPPSSKGKGKQKVNPPATKSDVSSVNTAQQAARDALRKKKQEEKEELARIQARIEADKAARKAEAERRKAERERERQGQTTSFSSPAPTNTSAKSSQAKEVHLNVRLFDGRTVRSTFPREAKLQEDVRPWIDSEFAVRAEDPNEKHPPYYFKQILAPLPSRELSAGEESEALGDIDLAPSATLVLIPVKGYTEAYSGRRRGVVGGIVGGVTGVIGGVAGLAYDTASYVGSTIGSVVGYGQSTTPEGTGPSGRTLSEQRPETPDSAGIRVRTLADQREREPRNQELYNGNQVS